ncbi:tyrosine-type recombinase/integrase [Streptomyces sp. NPDC001156]
MASIRKRVRKDGSTAHQVRWREGGSREGAPQSEVFDSEPEAIQFKALVDAHGQQWPPGWVKGEGFVTPGEDDAAKNVVTFATWAEHFVETLTGVEVRTRHDYRRDIRNHVRPFFGEKDICDPDAITPSDIRRWVNALESGERDPKNREKWVRKPVSPKTIANLHGLLYGIFQSAVEAQPALRAANPCSKTRLPRVDDGIEDEMVFLEREEFDLVRAAMETICKGDALDLIDVMAGTGLRWGEISALQVRDITLRGAHKVLRVQRAWKRQEDNSFRLGKPKTKKSRRSVVLSPALVEILERNIEGKKAEDFVFTTAWGNPWRHGNFYNRRWLPAVALAQKEGLTKKPRPHDLRHTHVSWLIAANVPLPAIQARLGHESITTTVDRYGHLVQQLDDEVAAAVEAAMTGERPALRLAS